MNIEEQVRRGNEAQRLMDDPLLKGAFDGVREGLVAAMEQSKMADNHTHHELVLSLQLLARIRGSLLYHMQTGEIARKETLAQKAKNALRRVR